jgi:membrane-anchored glycerophosphoryl diester phosphodiesterase (GDPDase)
MAVVAIGAGFVLPETAGVVLMFVVGAALFVVLGVYVFAGLSLFLPGIVVERLTAYQAIKRGFELAKGGQFRIVAVVFLSWVLIFVPLMAVYFLTGTAGMLMDPTALSTGVVSMTQVVIQQLLSIVASGLTTPFMVACILLLHYDQRVRREAFDLQAEADALAL